MLWNRWTSTMARSPTTGSTADGSASSRFSRHSTDRSSRLPRPTGRARQPSASSARMLAPKHQHLVMRHLVHGPRDAADAVPGLLAAGERHPVTAERGVIVDQYGRGVQTLRSTECDVQPVGENTRLKRQRQTVCPLERVV